MSERKIMSLALKVLGFYCIIQAVHSFQAFMGTLAFGILGLTVTFNTSELLLQVTAFIGIAAFIILAFLFIIKSNKWATTLYPDEKITDLSSASPQIGWYELILVLMGIMLLIRVFQIDLIKLVGYIISMKVAQEYPPATGRVWSSVITTSIQFVFDLGLGFYLVFGSKGLARFLYSIRGKSLKSDQ